MIKKIAWNTFKNTGNINTFLELKQLEEQTRAEIYENDKNKWNNNCGKNDIRF